MQKNIKRLSLALLALGLSAPAFASTCNPFTVTVPNQNGGFTISADALYLQPSTNFGLYSTTPLTGITPVSGVMTAKSNTVDPSYHWGFDVMAAYRIPGTGNDISATWTHLDQMSDSATPVLPIFTVSANALGIPPGNYAVSDQNSSQFNYDAVDADVGQRVNFGDYFQFRTFAGVRWAELKTDKSLTLKADAISLSELGLTAVSGVIQAQQNSRFDGVGPQIGIEGRYCVGYGFGIDANLTTSLLVGSVDSDSQNNFLISPTIAGTTTPTTTTIIQNLDADSKTRVVPVIDANLGLDYTYNFNNCGRSSLVVQAGWKVINYFDVAQHLNGASPFGTGTTIGDGNDSKNVAFQGPYAGIKVNL